jgi:uncharacterized membrane protein
MEPSRAFELTETVVEEAVRWIRLAIETTGAAIIALGLVVALAAFVRTFRRRHDPADSLEGYNGVRLTLSRYLALALEFQLGADILSTAIAPSWDQIGKLGAIAFIRTALNYFLGREMREETGRAELRRQARAGDQADDRAEERGAGRDAAAAVGNAAHCDAPGRVP